jgi:uncharacterized membrane protein
MKAQHIYPAVALLFSSILAVADPLSPYTLTQIGPVPENGIGLTFVTDLNEKGELAGAIIGADALHPFFWRSGEMTLLGNAGQITAGLNDRSQVVTVASTPTIVEGAVLWQRGEFRALGSPSPTALFMPVDITNSGRVLGTVFDAVTFIPEVYLRERSGDFGLLERLHSSASMHAQGINNRGIVIGFSEVVVGDRVLVQSVRWRDGAVERLSMPPGTGFDTALDINERGQIVGEISVDGSLSGYIWHNGRTTLLPLIDPTLDGASGAAGINNRGWVVGTTISPVTDGLATLWVNGVAYDLNTLISPDDSLQPFVRLMSASFINNAGLIVAGGIDSRRPGTSGGSPYLLTPRH